jgi:hypothetical protein
VRGKCTALTTPLEVQTQVPKLNATAKGRLLFEEVVVGLRRTQPAHPNTFIAIRNLGATIMKIGDIMAGLALQEEAAASALRELGPNHPCTQQLSEASTHMWQTVAAYRSNISVWHPCYRSPGRPGLQAGAQQLA